MPSSARKNIIMSEEVSTYHVTTRCVRRCFLCGIDPYTGKNFDHRKGWIRDRLRILSNIFAVDIGAYTILSNHFHANYRIRPDIAKKWDNREVIKRWCMLCPQRKKGMTLKEPTEEYIQEKLKDQKWIENRRRRLYSLSWFMRFICEYIARKANKEDNVKGRFWEGRFKSEHLLDEELILAANIYIDLNPVRAQIAENLEDSNYTSIQDRINKHLKKENNPDYFLTKLDDSNQATSSIDIPFLSINERDYIEIVDWYGRMQHKDKKGYIKEASPSVLEKYDYNNIIDPEWIFTLFKKKCSWVVGKSDSLEKKAKETGRLWIKGQKYIKKVLE